ncbi:MAG: hypothetical protein QM675_09795 [Protaetiibacter sp.]
MRAEEDDHETQLAARGGVAQLAAEHPAAEPGRRAVERFTEVAVPALVTWGRARESTV